MEIIRKYKHWYLVWLDYIGRNTHSALAQKSRKGNVWTFQLVFILWARIPNFLVSDECEAIDELIKAYRKGDS